MRTLTCARCGAAIAKVDDHAGALISSSICERCSHPAYYHLGRRSVP